MENKTRNQGSRSEPKYYNMLENTSGTENRVKLFIYPVSSYGGFPILKKKTTKKKNKQQQQKTKTKKQQKTKKNKTKKQQQQTNIGHDVKA